MNITQIGKMEKFSFAEMTSNNNGKTSGTSVSGIYVIAIGGLCFLMGTVDKMFLSKTTEIMSQATNVILIGAALMGVKNIWNSGKGTENDKPIGLEPAEPTKPAEADATSTQLAEPEQVNS